MPKKILLTALSVSVLLALLQNSVFAAQIKVKFKVDGIT